MVSNQESNALAKQLPIGYTIQNYTIKAYLNQSYFANIYLVEAPSYGENLANGQNQETKQPETKQPEIKQYVLKEYFPYFVTRTSDFSVDADAYQEHLAWGKAHALKKAQFLAQINSPHVANIRSYFEANNTVYLLRDYYEGLTLTEWLRQMRLEHLVQKLDLSPDAISEAMLSEVKLSLEDTKKLLYPVIDALSFMHSYRASEFAYSHENISPDNIFLEKSVSKGLTTPKAVLLDGIGAGAKINPDLLAAGYAPPESYGQYDAYKPSGDVYSLAATMYSLLTGNVPAHAQERLTVRDNEDLDLSTVMPGLDLKLCKALHTNPNERYGSALSFLQALQTSAMDISEASDIRDALPVPTVRTLNEQTNTPTEKTTTNKYAATKAIEGNETIEKPLDSELDPALKVTEVASILWSDPSEDMMPVTFGDYAGVKPETSDEATTHLAKQTNNNTHDTHENAPEVVLNHPAFFQVDGQVTSQQHTPQSSQDAISTLNDQNFKQMITEEAITSGIYDSGTYNSNTYNLDTYDPENYNYSESIELTAPESFLTQEKQISAEEAKTTLFSVHPVHPLQTKTHDVATFDETINKQSLLHHAELLKGSTAFQYIDGKLKNKDASEANSVLEEDYNKTVIYNTQVTMTSNQALLEADSLLHDSKLNNSKLNSSKLNSSKLNSSKNELQNQLEQTGIKGLSEWPISALSTIQNKKTRERKPVQKRFPTLVDVFKTGFSADTTQQAAQTSGLNLQHIVRVVMLITLLVAFGILVFSMRLQTPRTPFQNGTARAFVTPQQTAPHNAVPHNAVPQQPIAQTIKHTSNTQPTLSASERLSISPEFAFGKHKQAVRAVAFNPEGNLIASAGDDKLIHLWNKQTQGLVKTLEPITGSAFIKDIAFSTDYLAAVDTSGMVVLWDIHTGAKQKMDLYKHTDALNSVSFSHDATFLAVGSEDGKVLLWEKSNNSFGKMQMLDISQTAITKLSFNPKDSSVLVVADKSLRIHLWNSNRKRIQTITAWNTMSRLNDIKFSSDGLNLAVAGLDKDSVGIINIWDVATRGLELTLHHPKFHSEGFSIRPESANSVRAITADPDGKWWASAGIDGIIHLWNPTSGALLESMSTDNKGIYNLDANPLTQGLVTASADGSVLTWLVE